LIENSTLKGLYPKSKFLIKGIFGLHKIAVNKVFVHLTSYYWFLLENNLVFGVMHVAGRNSSAGSVYDEGPQATKVANGPGNNNTFSATTQNTPTGHPNEHPGYPLHLPQLSSQNSSGYSGQNTSVHGERPPQSQQQQRQQQQTDNSSWSSGGQSARSSEQNRNWANESRNQHQQQATPPPSDRGGTSHING